MTDVARFHPDIPHDLAAAISWYDSISIELGNRFRNSVATTFQLIQQQPLVYGFLFDDVRGLRIEGFPYLAQYRMIGETPFVLGIFHAASDPSRWRERAR